MSKLVIFLISIYKSIMSPYLGANCRFSPTCSVYAILCFEKLPFYKALWYASVRIIKCQPFCKGGHQPLVIEKS